MDRLPVSIVTYRTPVSELEQVMTCLGGDAVGTVTIIDNARDPEMERFCASRPGMVYIPSDNVGYGAAHNIAIRRSMEAGAEYHLVINSDIVFAPSDLDGMLRYMHEHPDVGALHPRVVGLDGEDQYTVRMLPRPADLFVRRFMPGWVFRRQRDRYLLKHMDHTREFDVQYMQGSFMLLRLSVLRQVGLFDEQFFMYAEDVDLTRRIAERSRAVYYPYAVVTHAHRAASYSSWRMTWIHAVNMLRYFKKWRRINRRTKR